MISCKRISHGLLLIVYLTLTGFGGFDCSDDDDDSSGGSTDTSIRVDDEQKISATRGNFSGVLADGDRFGSAVTDLGDLESDGVRDLAVGVPFDDDGGNDRGAIWVLFMDDTGEVDTEQKISDTRGGFGGVLDLLNDGDLFGSAVAGIGDLDNDGVFDLAAGVPGDDAGGIDRGGLWILFLDTDGTVMDQQKIADNIGGFDGRLADGDAFGSAITRIGDVNGDNITDLAVGAPNDDDRATDAGAVWILFMDNDGRVDSSQKISANEGNFDGTLRAGDRFGAAVAAIGDLNGDGIPDLAVGTPDSDENGPERGAIWILFLRADGKVLSERQITNGESDFDGRLRDGDRFGSAIGSVGDLNNDGVSDLAVGAPNDDDGADNAGAIWVLLMRTNGRVDGWQKISDDVGNFDGRLQADDNFGAAIEGIANLDNIKLRDLAVGAPGDDDGGTEQGALWILFLETSN